MYVLFHPLSLMLLCYAVLCRTAIGQNGSAFVVLKTNLFTLSSIDTQYSFQYISQDNCYDMKNFYILNHINNLVHLEIKSKL